MVHCVYKIDREARPQRLRMMPGVTPFPRDYSDSLMSREKNFTRKNYLEP
jgi:hypothetical protein